MQAVISGSVDIGIARGHRRGDGSVRQGRAGADHRRGRHRRERPLLVRARRLRRSARSRMPPARPSPIRPTAPRPTSRCSRSSSISTSRRGRSRPAPRGDVHPGDERDRSTSAGRRRRSGSMRSTTAASGSIARGSDVPETRGQTVRVHIVNAAVLAARAQAIDRFMEAYREAYAVPLQRPTRARLLCRHRQSVGAARRRKSATPSCRSGDGAGPRVRHRREHGRCCRRENARREADAGRACSTHPHSPSALIGRRTHRWNSNRNRSPRNGSAPMPRPMRRAAPTPRAAACRGWSNCWRRSRPASALDIATGAGHVALALAPHAAPCRRLRPDAADAGGGARPRHRAPTSPTSASPTCAPRRCRSRTPPSTS